MKKALRILLPIIIMTAIFIFSSQDAATSTVASTSVGMTYGKLFVEDFSKLPLEEQIAYAIGVDENVRHVGHGLEFLILAISIFIALTLTKIRGIYRYLTSLAITVACAIGDEIHQLFVVGRAAQVSDVIIDSIGAFLGMLICALTIKIYNTRPPQKKSLERK